MGAMGDAGAIICNNKKLFDKISRYRNHGSLKKHDHLTFGINSRLDTFQASILNKKITIKNFNLRRIKIAKIYKKLLKDNPFIEIPKTRKKVTILIINLS